MRTAIAALALALAGLGAPALATADAATAAPSVLARHACTKTSTGHCIKGGQFCPKASYGHAGYDAQGRKYICKGNHTHPHWMLP
jgi:hypothetical protein